MINLKGGNRVAQGVLFQKGTDLVLRFTQTAGVKMVRASVIQDSRTAIRLPGFAQSCHPLSSTPQSVSITSAPGETLQDTHLYRSALLVEGTLKIIAACTRDLFLAAVLACKRGGGGAEILC